MTKITGTVGAIELLQGLTVEEMRAVYFDAEALIEPPYKVYQLNVSGFRWYYTLSKDGEPQFFPSVTTIIDQAVPKAKHLVKWIADVGYEESRRYMMDRAAYGTFMHGIFARLLISRNYDLDKLKDELRSYIESEGLPSDFIHNADELKKDVLAFAAWVMDYDVRPLAIEIALVHPIHGYGGMIDLPCDMKEKPDSKKRITAIVDFKSGRKGFYEANEIQLHLYKEMWNTNFPDHKIDRVFNFSPKDWRKYPSYNFTDQTGSVNAEKIPYILKISEIENRKKERTFTSVFGQVSLDNKNLMNNIKVMTLADVVKLREVTEDQPEGAVNSEDLKIEDSATPEEDNKLNDLLNSDF